MWSQQLAIGLPRSPVPQQQLRRRLAQANCLFSTETWSKLAVSSSPDETISLLSTVNTNGLTSETANQARDSLGQILDRFQQNDKVCAKGLEALSGLTKTQKDAHAALPTVLKVLEARRERRVKASVQELQKNDWGDCDVFKASKVLLDSIASHEPEYFKGLSRTDLGRARRLLVYSPPASTDDRLHNIKPYIAEMAQRDLLLHENDHPLAMLASIVRTTFKDFDYFGPNLDPIVTTKQCFDDLLVPSDHVSRSPSDTFYFDKQTVLRAHTSAHQTQFLSKGYSQFLVSGDVYRRDEIDKTHFPVFHQMEGVKILPVGATKEEAFEDLKAHLNRLADVLFPGRPRKWIDAYFPFTDPSLELEIDFNNKSVELLGCGVVQPAILKQCGLEGRVGWAFGLGLERLAMILFSIPDIRLFWAEDKRFLDQFQNCKEKFLKRGKPVKFKPFSKYPPSKRDISFWLPKGQTGFHANDFFSIVREIGKNDVEEVTHLDDYIGPDGRTSKAFRIIYRSDFKTLSGADVNTMMENITSRLVKDYGVEIR